MQFSVPQFVEIEDRIIGPLTLKQFLVLGAGGLLIFLLYRVIGNIIFLILASLPIGGVTVIIAFGKFNGRTVPELMLSGLGFVSEPRSFIFHKSSQAQKQPEDEIVEAVEKPKESQEDRLSRLHKLTYILDQSEKSESQIIKDKFSRIR